ncbi:thioesterase [Oceanobacillus caeni]|uniref:Thioesterase n=1 Tax=Oceanobacillus caeni TaxID=405946 RepID=A0ABR5MJ97_9BACI|nr:thioesterase [Bacilli bacterium VT-13-104]KPH74542.1 thioesterase [Oceanobacillus caeni]
MKGRGADVLLKTIITPRVSETDGVGHINNTTIPIWFEAGRNEIFKMFTSDLSFEDWRCIILNMNVDYLKQIYYGRDVIIKTHVEKIGNSSFTLYEEMFQNEELCAKGRAVYVNFNRKKQATEPIPDEIRLQLEEHLIQE